MKVIGYVWTTQNEPPDIAAQTLTLRQWCAAKGVDLAFVATDLDLPAFAPDPASVTARPGLTSAIAGARKAREADSADGVTVLLVSSRSRFDRDQVARTVISELAAAAGAMIRGTEEHLWR
jgi:hypothetical protein